MTGPAIAAAAVVVLVAALLALWRRVLVVTVRGGSMTPALHEGDRVVVWRRPGRISAARDLVVVRAPETAYEAAIRPIRIKRLVGRPGDRVPAVISAAQGWDRDFVVPPGRVAVLGDHPRSEDSKQWGLIPADRIVGFVVRMLPPETSEHASHP
ncbi:hypothetical protein Cs7R123_49650 [Catellatospora sp. TT07R-123]|uniref:S26 family signal peptidase n=1 Tax=Catellatospora sp. TT07R-123 TaxID=2733863 RepID=UPI001B049B5E|nr:S26 family signal peptidase [Catellatospora sp. TT07R-123]GHJ47623.1 hypothetical protein Cs7R123_49650 [Catellatospora sp. TT07R-123]